MPEFYCDNTNGNDGTGSGAWNDPYKTLQKCVDVASGGDTIWIGDTSAQVLAASISWGGGWGAGTSRDLPLIIRGWDYSAGEGVDGVGEIDGNDAVVTLFAVAAIPSYVILYRLKLHTTTGIVIDSSTYWNLFECEIYDGGTTLIDNAAQNQVVIGCEIHTTGGAGVHGMELGAFSFAMFNYIHGTTGAGVRLAGLNSVLAFNLIHSTDEDGVSCLADDCLIVGNTIVGQSAATDDGIDVGSAIEGMFVFNNIITNWGTGGTGKGIDVPAGSNIFLIGHNHFFGNDGDEDIATQFIDLGNDQTTDPEFTNAGGEDYSVGSNCQDKGYPATFKGSSTASNLPTGASMYVAAAAVFNVIIGGGIVA